MLCPDLSRHQEYELEGNELFVNQTNVNQNVPFSYMSFEVQTCESGPGKACNDNKIKEFLTLENVLFFAYNDSYVDFDNHPGRLFSDYINFDTKFKLNESVTKTAKYNVRPL